MYYKYKYVRFIAENIEEAENIQKAFFEHGFHWAVPGEETDIWLGFFKYPTYLFINTSLKEISYAYNNHCSEYDSDVTNPTIYSYKDIKYLKSILINGVKKPSYKPKGKIRRIDESFGGKRTLHIFKIEDREQFVNIQRKLFELDYYWGNGKKLNFHGSYPFALFVKNMKDAPGREKTLSTYHNTDNSLEEYIKRYYSYWDFVKIFESYNINNLEKILKFGIEKPSYKPKGKIRRIDESTDINIIYVYTESYDNAIEFQNILQRNGYAWHNSRTLNVVQWFLKEFKSQSMYFRININNKSLVGTITKPSFIDSYVYSHEKNRILNILKIIIPPSYKPKGKIRRIDESLDNNKKLHVFILKNNKEFVITQEKLFEKGFLWPNKKSKIWNEDSFGFYPINLFVRDNPDEVINKKLTVFHTDRIELLNEYINVAYSEYSKNIYTFEDLSNLDTILKYGHKKPSYKPKGKISRLDENILLPKLESPILTIEEQEHNFKIGDVVYVRPDARTYFTDIVPKMDVYFGEECVITDIIKNYVFFVYGAWYFPKKCAKNGDFLIVLKLLNKPKHPVNEYNYGWYYRCLIKKEDIKPSYKPKGRITRG